MRPLAARLALLVGSLLLFGLGLEAAFRVLGIRGYHEDRVVQARGRLTVPDEERTPGVSVQFRPHGEYRIAYDSDPRGYFDAGAGLTYRLNARGLRGPDFPDRKPPGGLRVALLGDSFTFGEGVRVEDTFAHRLGPLLARAAGREVEVLNLGHPMWSTSDEIAYFQHVARGFAPDLVLLVYVLNDADYAGDLDLHDRFRASYEPRGWIRRSRLLSFAKSRIGRERYGRAYVASMLRDSFAQQEKWHRSFALLATGRDEAHAIGARYAVVIFPFLYALGEDHPFRILHERIRDFTGARGIPTLDLLPSFSGRDHMDLWAHPSDPHPNELAHAIAAEAIARFVIDHGLLL